MSVGITFLLESNKRIVSLTPPPLHPFAWSQLIGLTGIVQVMVDGHGHGLLNTNDHINKTHISV